MVLKILRSSLLPSLAGTRTPICPDLSINCESINIQRQCQGWISTRRILTVTGQDCNRPTYRFKSGSKGVEDIIVSFTSVQSNSTLTTELIAQAPETLIVNHDSGISGADFFIVRASDRALLVAVDGKLLSWTQRRTFRDASGLPLFDLYRKAMGVTWFVELPDERGGEPIMTIAPRTSVFKDELDLFVHNAANQGEVVKLEVRGQDIWKMRVNVYLGDQVVMSSKRTEKLAGYIPGKRPDWEVDIAEGFDASLAAVIMVVLAATLYDSSMKTSLSAGAAGGSSGC